MYKAGSAFLGTSAFDRSGRGCLPVTVPMQNFASYFVKICAMSAAVRRGEKNGGKKGGAREKREGGL